MPDVTLTPKEVEMLEAWRANGSHPLEGLFQSGADSDDLDDGGDEDGDDLDDGGDEDGVCPECGAGPDEDCDEDCYYFDDDDDDDGDDDDDAFI